jgi:hypothetical protein
MYLRQDWEAWKTLLFEIPLYASTFPDSRLMSGIRIRVVESLTLSIRPSLTACEYGFVSPQLSAEAAGTWPSILEGTAMLGCRISLKNLLLAFGGYKGRPP